MCDMGGGEARAACTHIQAHVGRDKARLHCQPCRSTLTPSTHMDKTHIEYLLCARHSFAFLSVLAILLNTSVASLISWLFPLPNQLLFILLNPW